MFPLWDDDDEDPKVVTMVKAFFGKLDNGPNGPWRWSRQDWPVNGVIGMLGFKKEEKSIDPEKKRDHPFSDDEGDVGDSRKKQCTSTTHATSEGGSSLIDAMRSQIELCHLSLKRELMGCFVKCEESVSDLVIKVIGLEDAVQELKGIVQEHLKKKDGEEEKIQDDQSSKEENTPSKDNTNPDGASDADADADAEPTTRDEVGVSSQSKRKPKKNSQPKPKKKSQPKPKPKPYPKPVTVNRKNPPRNKKKN